jgi:riboflavin kinase/FMN adenylyltransferase
VKFFSRQKTGRGRARKLGFPTINLEVPENIKMEYGIYAVFFYCLNYKYVGAMHYGSSPAFKDEEVSLEIYLIDEKDETLPDFKNKKITIELIKYLRPVLDFKTKEELVEQIDDDVKKVRSLAK